MAPAATKAKDVSTSCSLVDKETLDLTYKLVTYDKMIEAARRMKDEKVERIIAQCKDMCVKRHRGLNKNHLDELERDLMRTQQDREALRARLREQDKKELALKKTAKIKRLKDEAVAREKKEERQALEKLKMRIDTRWVEQDFGQHLTEDQAKDFPKTAKVVIANYRVALERLKMRCPELPEHLQTQWEDFLGDFPITWLLDHRLRRGNVAGRAFLNSVDELFEAGLRW